MIDSKEVMPDADRDAGLDRPGGRGGRWGAVLVSEGRVPADPMNVPLNPEREPAPYAALRS